MCMPNEAKSASLTNYVQGGHCVAQIIGVTQDKGTIEVTVDVGSADCAIEQNQENDR